MNGFKDFVINGIDRSYKTICKINNLMDLVTLEISNKRKSQNSLKEWKFSTEIYD